MKYLIALALLLLCHPDGLTSKEKLSPHETIKKDHIKISYGRPYKRDREIFGKLVPYDMVWRTGADEATEITFEKPVKIDGKMLKAGTYTLFTIPGSAQWTIIFNGQLKQWGAFEYEKFKGKDVLTMKAEPKRLKKVVDPFTIEIKDDQIELMWDQTSVSIPYEMQ